MAIVPPRDFFLQPLQVNINGVLSANPPLSITGTTMSIADASLVSSGVVNTGAQSFAGAKTFAGDTTVSSATIGVSSAAGNAMQVAGTIGTQNGIWTGGPVNLDVAVGVVGTTPANSSLTLQANGGSNIELDSSPTGDIIATTGAFAGSAFRIIDGTTVSPVLVVDPTGSALYSPLSITLPGASPFNLVGSGGNTLFTISTGDLTINCSGNDLNLHSTDKVHVLNTTVATSTTTGAFTVSGGMGVVGGVWCGGSRMISATTPQVYIENNPGNTSSLSTDASGNLSITTSGTTATLKQATIDTVVLGSTLSKFNVGVEFDGYTRFKDALATLSPSGAGPFNDYVLGLVDTIYYIDLSSVTSGAHFTGFSFATLIKNRLIELVFVNTGGSKTIYIDHESGSSTAVYRVWCPGSSNLTITVNIHSVVRMLYSNYDDRWLLMSAI